MIKEVGNAPENYFSVNAASVENSQAESDIVAAMEKKTLKAGRRLKAYEVKQSEPDEPTEKIAKKKSKQPCLTKSEHVPEIVSTEVAYSKSKEAQIRREKATTCLPTVGCTSLHCSKIGIQRCAGCHHSLYCGEVCIQQLKCFDYKIMFATPFYCCLKVSNSTTREVNV